MKKQLLAILAMAAVAGVSSAASLSYGICGTAVSSTAGTQTAGTNYSVAIEVPGEVAMSMVGSKLTSVNVGWGSGANKKINLYLTYDLDAEPFYTQEVQVATGRFTSVDLTTPYEIEGREFYIGYTYRQTSKTGKPIAYDGEDHSGLDLFSHYSYWADGEEATRTWGTLPDCGALCLTANIEGNILPAAALLPVKMSLPMSVSPDLEFEYSMEVCNLASAPATAFTVNGIYGTTVQDADVELPQALNPGEKTSVRIKGLTNQHNDIMPVSLSISSVNGKENVWKSQSLTGSTACSGFTFTRMVVMEKGTGTGCGWCPRGIVTVEALKEAHPDDFLAIEVHSYSGDPMGCSDYSQWVSWAGGGYPFCTMNRDVSLGSAGKISPLPGTCEDYYQKLKGVVPVLVDIEADYADETRTSLRINTRLRWADDVSDSPYGVALVQTEDHVGPYKQQNNFAGGTNGPLYGWENKDSRVSMYYDDVARAIMNWDGAGSDLPTDIVANETYLYSEIMPIKDDKEQKHADTNVIALLIDRNTRAIVTAAKCKIGHKSGVNDINELPAASVYAVPGGIRVEGSFDRADIFGLDGRLAGSLSSSGSVSLAPGVYMVNVIEGQRHSTRKLAIR